MAVTQTPLGPNDLAKLRAFLARDPIAHLYLLGVLEEFGITPSEIKTPFAVWGQINAGELEAAIFIRGDGLGIPAGYSLAPLAELADSLSRECKVRVSFGEPTLVEALMRTMGERKPMTEKAQRLYVATADQLGPFTAPTLRLAEERDVPVLLSLAVGRPKERIGLGPLNEDPASLEQAILHRVRSKRTYVLEAQEQLVFTADIGLRSAYGAELEGFFTPPEHRRRGYATLSLGQLSRNLLASLPRITLRLEENDLSGKGLAQKVGYVRSKLQKLLIAE